MPRPTVVDGSTNHTHRSQWQTHFSKETLQQQQLMPELLSDSSPTASYERHDVLATGAHTKKHFGRPLAARLSEGDPYAHMCGRRAPPRRPLLAPVEHGDPYIHMCGPRGAGHSDCVSCPLTPVDSNWQSSTPSSFSRGCWANEVNLSPAGSGEATPIYPDDSASVRAMAKSRSRASSYGSNSSGRDADSPVQTHDELLFSPDDGASAADPCSTCHSQKAEGHQDAPAGFDTVEHCEDDGRGTVWADILTL